MHGVSLEQARTGSTIGQTCERADVSKNSKLAELAHESFSLENKTRGHRIKLLLHCYEVVEWSTVVYTQQLSETW